MLVTETADIEENANGALNGKILLILAPSYPNRGDSFIGGTFIKCQVAELKKYFRKIIVIAPVLQSLGYLKKDRLCKDYSYDNVEVYYPRSIYIPIFWLRRAVIDNRLKMVEKVIEENNLRFDLIHAHFTWPSGHIGVKLSEEYGKPVITTIHENGDWFDMEVEMNHHLINSTWSGANALIRVNKKDVPVLQRYNDNVYSIPNGFSPTFRPIDMTIAREQLGLPEDSKIIFTLGNLIERKGFNYLVDAMDVILSKRDDVLCFIGGAGPEEKSLQRQIGQLNLEGSVRLLGSIPGDQLTLWMNACDLFILSSLSESFGVVQIEALACGKPVVATRNGGSEEIIASDDYGLLVEPADPEDLANKILDALDRVWDKEKILRYAEQYTWENIVNKIMRVYVGIL